MGQALCCVSSTLCQCLCSICSSCGASRKVFARIGYVMFLLLWIILSILLLYYGHYIFMTPFGNFINCYEDAKEVCVGISAVYRTSATLLLFHLVLCLICLCKGEVASAIHEGAWPVKFLIITAIFVLSFFISNDVFKGYGYVAMVCSGVFMVYEMILLIDLAYTWNAHWIGQYDDNNKSSGSTNATACLIIGGMVIFYAGSIALYILMYYYADQASQYVVISLSLAAAFIYSIMSITSLVTGGSLFTCSIVSFFTATLTGSVLLSAADAIKDSDKKESLMITQILIGLAFMFFVLFYLGSRTKKPSGENEKTQPAQKASSQVVDAVAESDDKSDKAEQMMPSTSTTEAVPEVTYATSLFHLIMAAACLHYSMVLTNWGAPLIGNMEFKEFSNPWLGYWVKLGSMWIGILLFIWSLIAPRVCTCRDFS